PASTDPGRPPQRVRSGSLKPLVRNRGNVLEPHRSLTAAQAYAKWDRDAFGTTSVTMARGRPQSNRGDREDWLASYGHCRPHRPVKMIEAPRMSRASPYGPRAHGPAAADLSRCPVMERSPLPRSAR